MASQRRCPLWDPVVDHLQPYTGHSWNNHRAAIASLFYFAIKRGYASSNPTKKIEKRKRALGHRPAVLSPADFEGLLMCAWSKSAWDVIAWLVLGGMCGLRPFEALRMQWLNIDLEHRELVVRPEQSKVRFRRVMPIHEAAVAWLKTYKFYYSPEDRIFPANWMWVWEKWRKNHAQDLWPMGEKDLLRHSFCTYARAITTGIDEIARWAGTSPSMIARYYDSVESLRDSEAWRRILPPGSRRPALVP